MIVAIDIGNTNIVFGIFISGHLKEVLRLETSAVKRPQDYAKFLANKINLVEIEDIIVGSVVPELNASLKLFAADYCNGLRPLFVNASDTMKPKADIENPEEVGDDLLANTIAAHSLYGGDAIVIDFGTATTFSVVSAKGEFSGTVIAPGVNLALNALAANTARLPSIEIAKPSSVKGRNTVQCMQSGIYYGYVGLVENIVKELQKEHNGNLRVIATGGLSSLFANDIAIIDHVEPNLTLLGLHYLYKLNRYDTAKDANGN